LAEAAGTDAKVVLFGGGSGTMIHDALSEGKVEVAESRSGIELARLLMEKAAGDERSSSASSTMRTSRTTVLGLCPAGC
jgi:hypothetical protein